MKSKDEITPSERLMFQPRGYWPDPKPEMLARPEFEVIWTVIKTWDINVPGAYSGYMGATGNHVRAILEALDAVEGK